MRVPSSCAVDRRRYSMNDHHVVIRYPIMHCLSSLQRASCTTSSPCAITTDAWASDTTRYVTSSTLVLLRSPHTP